MFLEDLVSNRIFSSGQDNIIFYCNDQWFGTSMKQQIYVEREYMHHLLYVLKNFSVSVSNYVYCSHDWLLYHVLLKKRVWCAE